VALIIHVDTGDKVSIGDVMMVYENKINQDAIFTVTYDDSSETVTLKEGVHTPIGKAIIKLQRRVGRKASLVVAAPRSINIELHHTSRESA